VHDGCHLSTKREEAAASGFIERMW
jgi:hypothetical protein